MTDDPLFDRLVPVLRRDEGWALLPYKDSLGILTIGCGHNLSVPITNAAVTQILRDDVDAVRDALWHYHWFTNLDTVRQGVLINVGFMGVGKLLAFRQMIGALERQDYEAAADEMLDSMWAKQVGDRAVRQAEQMRRGEWL